MPELFLDTSYALALSAKTDRHHSRAMVDCVSFVVMNDRRLRDCLTTDRHFKQAGFQALLLEA
jgi:predicted nucleic acid-binding protein